MRQITQLKALAFALITVVFISSCGKDRKDDEPTVLPITLGTEVSVKNTIQLAADPSLGGTGGVELPIEGLFGLPANALVATNTVSNSIEFDNYLNGLYDIDLSENKITFDLVAPANDPTYSPIFRTIEAGTFDRYYFTFSSSHNVKGFSSSNSSVNLRIDSDKVLVVEISEGFDFNSGATFTITLN